MQKLSKNRLKLIASLKHKKFRRKHSLFLAEGEKPVEVALKSKSGHISCLVFTEKFSRKFRDFQGEKFVVNEEQFRKISTQENPEGVLAVMRFFRFPGLFRRKKLVFLIEINDPGNLGTILRIADWFSLGGVISVGNSVDFFNPKTVRASMGSLFNVPFGNISLAEAENFLKKNLCQTALADVQGENLYQSSIREINYLFFGSESHGFSSIDVAGARKITIPKFGKNIDSLNLATSLSVFAYEWKRT